MPALRLLVVESDEERFRLMKDLFTHLKADVSGVGENGRAAELVNRERFDGILLNASAPNANGFDLVRWIRNSSYNRSTPVVALVGNDDQKVIQWAFDSGATFYLAKPFDHHTLSSVFSTVRRSLYEHRRRYVRIPLQVDLTCFDDAGQLIGTTQNLSRGGLQVAVERLSPGESKHLSFKLPFPPTSIEASGSVVWVEEKRQGIKFEHIRPEHEQAIENYIAWIMAQESLTK
jgi:CheY-like chemotaxis protein